MRVLASLLLVVALAPAVSSSASRPLPAFPGASGFGSRTPGGRGGRVIAVTNLNDSGPGSLREACAANGARIIVFRVSGTIELRSPLRISSPFATIAGQTAPGGGVQLTGAGLRIATHDVVVRFLRVRIGESDAVDAAGQDGLSISGKEPDGLAYNVIVDSCSLSWATDENADSYSRASDFTISNCIISEGLMNSIHPKGAHSMGLLLGPGSTRATIHSNLFAHNNQRNPRIRGGRRDIVNNVIYNWGSHAAALSDDPEVNFVGNYYKPGPNSSGRRIVSGGDDSGRIYLRDNFVDGQGPFDWEQVEPDEVDHRAAKRFHAPLTDCLSPKDAYEHVLTNAGCTRPERDGVDERIVREVRQSAGRIIDSPEQVGGLPPIAAAPAPADSDCDGMPDDYERGRGLDPGDPRDAPQLGDDGYTNIERCLNGLAGQADSSAGQRP